MGRRKKGRVSSGRGRKKEGETTARGTSAHLLEYVL